MTVRSGAVEHIVSIMTLLLISVIWHMCQIEAPSAAAQPPASMLCCRHAQGPHLCTLCLLRSLQVGLRRKE